MKKSSLSLSLAEEKLASHSGPWKISTATWHSAAMSPCRDRPSLALPDFLQQSRAGRRGGRCGVERKGGREGEEEGRERAGRKGHL